MSQDDYFSQPVFGKTTGPLTPSEIQWIYSGNGGGTPSEDAGPRVRKVRAFLAGLKDRKKILDVGCANGAILKPLRN